ncbi:glycosyltransferase family 2 protein [Thiohalocapsa marina]|uniref:Glycosyltransferase family 2 protein n=1 Tax=Thiohalocapsa marina TaxID=424902 RepID=A0A5M8FVX2_9GAMM|nr:glycosyltransferase family 2 protein [Thiohalocapsa marina]
MRRGTLRSSFWASNWKPLVVVIPAFNEAASIANVVAEVRHHVNGPTLVVDDASTDDTAVRAEAIGATVLRLPFRLGAWGATQAGLRYALRQDWQVVVTLDADGQHMPADVGPVLSPVLSGTADVAIGAYPERASASRQLARRFFQGIGGLAVEDLTSGFRAYNRRAIAKLAQPYATLFDYQDVGVLLDLKRHGFRVVEVPVRMRDRRHGHSRIFHSWWAVTRYMLQTSVLCLAYAGRGTSRSAQSRPHGKSV